MRAALGAHRGRLARGSLTESALLVGTAGVAGIGAAALGGGVLRRWAPVNIPRLSEVGLNPVVVGVALAACLVTAVLLGLIPLLRPRRDPGASLRDGGWGTVSGGRLRGRNVLVATQVALALVLLIGSGLLFRTFRQRRSVDPGFTTRRALTFEIGLPPSRYATRVDARRFHDALLSRLRALPGVTSAAAVGQCLPLSDGMCWGETLQAEGHPTPKGQVPPVTGARVASADYFRAMGIAVRGRAFTSSAETGPAVAILSEAAAAAYFPGEDAVGRRVRFGEDDSWRTVVGVARNVRGRLSTDDFERLIYLPMRAAETAGPPPSQMAYVLRTDVAPTSLAPAVRRVLADLDPSIPMADVRTVADPVARATAPTSFALVLIGLAAFISLLLGAVGVYAVVAYAVSRRTAEIGVRMAFGAGITDVRRMVLRQGGRVVLVGVGLGLVAPAC
ncbi:MAG TPA: ABC transporter permease [Longimicrobiales bacterium]|nr:ABC transporter permease [Longimicrobiales bacterium]